MLLAAYSSQRLDPDHPSAQFITDIVVRDDDIGNNSLIQLRLSKDDLFYIGSNHSLWLRNASIPPGTYDIEIQAKNFQLETKKFFHVLIFDRHSFRLNIFENMTGKFSRFSLWLIVSISFVATGSTIFLLVYYLWIRLHYAENVQKRLYGSRLIVNDEDKSKQNSPQTKSSVLSTIHNHDYAVIVKPRKVRRRERAEASVCLCSDGR